MERDIKKSVAVIGSRAEVLPFVAIGADVYVTEDIGEAKKAVVNFAEKNYPVIMITDDLIIQMAEFIESYSSFPVPSITAIPGKSGTSAFSRERLSNKVKRAIGIDLEGLADK